MKGTLKPNWRTFAEKIAAGTNATTAYLESGYQSTNRKNAQRAAWRLTQKPEIAAYIQTLRTTAATRSQAETTLTIEEKLAFLTRAIRTGAGGISGAHELCQSYRQFSDGSISIRTPCKLRAIKLHTELTGTMPPKSKTTTLEIPQSLFDQIRSGTT